MRWAHVRQQWRTTLTYVQVRYKRGNIRIFKAPWHSYEEVWHESRNVYKHTVPLLDAKAKMSGEKGTRRTSLTCVTPNTLICGPACRLSYDPSISTCWNTVGTLVSTVRAQGRASAPILSLAGSMGLSRGRSQASAPPSDSRRVA
jgi:hypothetical protein